MFIATPTSAWASAGCVVGAVAGHGDQPAALLLLADQRHLVLGRGLGEEVVDAGLARRWPAAVQRVVAGDHDGADAHRAQLGEPLAHARLDDVLEVDHAEHPGRPVLALRDDQRRAALRRRSRRRSALTRRRRAAVVRDPAPSPRRGALADLRGRRRSSPLMRVCAVNWTKSAPASVGRSPRSRRPCSAWPELDDAAALGRLVGQAGQLRGLGQLGGVDAGQPGGARWPAGCRG